MSAQRFVLTQEVLIDAPRDVVYEFFTKPELLMQWMGVAAELDPVVGGVMEVNVTGQDVTVGEFIELVPGERLVFTWGFNEPGATQVTVNLSSPLDTPNQTRVTLQHVGFTDATQRDAHRQGWRHYLARLQLAGAGNAPGMDSRVRAPAKTPGNPPKD